MPAAGTGAGQAGLWYALAAVTIWGLFPIYIKGMSEANPLEILCHRIIWSMPVTAAMVALRRGWPDLAQDLRRPGVLLTLMGSALFITLNWLGYIYAVNSGQVLQTSLAYFIYPLLNTLLGRIFLGERLRRGQVAAVILALSGTLVLAIGYGQTPWLALMLACFFGFYGLLRKRVAIDAVGGLFVETALLTPLALACLWVLDTRGQMAFFQTGWSTQTLLLAAGLATSLPLVWFTRASRRMSLTALGMCTYLGPTLQFLLAVFLYGEPFTGIHMVSFALIWSGLLLFMGELVQHGRQAGHAS
jgi:chloramphenicol-sensitive protein RarD